MAKYHKHMGVKGSHLITNKHKDKKTQKYHEDSIAGGGLKKHIDSKEGKSKKIKVVKRTYMIDLTKKDNINTLIVKGKDKNGKEYTVKFKKYNNM